MYWTQVAYSFYMLKGWWRAINSLKWENSSICSALLHELTLDNKKQSLYDYDSWTKYFFLLKAFILFSL